MNEALVQARRGAVVIGAIIVFSILTFHWLTEKPLLESIYWTVITISGVGYSQDAGQAIGPGRQLLSIFVILVGMLALAYTIGMLIQAIVEGQIDRAMGARRMNKEIQRLKKHVIICGFGRIGQNLAHRLARHRVPFIVVDSCVESGAEAKAHDYLYLEGDATDEEVLHAAGIERAETVVNALSSDADNVFLTLTVHNLNPNARILARGEHPRTEKKLIQAGASQVVLPAVIGAERMADIIIRPEASHLLRCVGHESGMNAELEEFKFTSMSPFVGKTVREAEDEHPVMIIALRRADGEQVFNPKDDLILEVGDVVIVMGPEAEVEQFYESCIAPENIAELV